jgi:hypothetical protein
MADTMKIAYAITKSKDGKQSYWNKIGVCYTNRDGSLNVKLFATPIDGELQIRDYVPKDDNDQSGRSRKPASIKDEPPLDPDDIPF